MANASRRAATGRAHALSCAQNPAGRPPFLRRTSGRLLRAALLAGAGLLALAPVHADETISYTYDARGRLKQVAHAGTINSGVTATYQLDPADNRSNLTVTGVTLPPSFAISGGTVTEGGAITFTVTRSNSTGGTNAVSYATANGTADTSRYNSTSNTLTFAPGDTQKTFTVQTIDDSIINGNQNFYVNLSNATGGAVIGTSQATGTINDNDSVTFSISGGTATEGGSVAFTVTRGGMTTGTYSVNYATANGSATAGSDYTTTSGTLTFVSGQTQQTISVPTIDDTQIESQENFYVNLSSPTGGATIGTSQATGVINDNDAPVFSIGNAQATEGGTLSFTVTRSGSATGTGTVNWATANGTAVAGSDYNAGSGTLSFAANGTQTINISTINDTVSEPTEQMYVNLSGGNGTISTSQGVGTINDDDPSTLTVTVPAGGSVNLRTLANSNGYTNQTSVTFNLPSGSTVTGGAGGGAAIDTGSWSGTALTLNVSGTVLGGGGNGGNGGGWNGTGNNSPTSGGSGGDAITCHAPITINVSGAVKAGGGGGGGGGYVTHTTGGPGQATEGGGGGGGGQPNGTGGTGGAGNNGGGTGGAGGAGTTSGGGAGGTSSVAAGGTGGTYANPGSNGVGGMSGPGMGGATGYAVRVNSTGCTANGNITGTVG
jgi:hypothetical protein